MCEDLGSRRNPKSSHFLSYPFLPVWNRVNEVKSVKPENASSNPHLNVDWHILGNINLPVNPSPLSGMMVWLGQTLDPLNLSIDFLDKILKSTQVSMLRVIPVETGAKVTDLQLIVFTPAAGIRLGQNWGFFLIEKHEAATADDCDACFVIELYLYREGN